MRTPTPSPRLAPAIVVRHPAGSSAVRRATVAHVAFGLVFLASFGFGVITMGQVAARLVFLLVGA